MIGERRRRGIGLIVLAAMVALALAACGRRNAPMPPPGTPNTYPRTYPSE